MARLGGNDHKLTKFIHKYHGQGGVGDLMGLPTHQKGRPYTSCFLLFLRQTPAKLCGIFCVCAHKVEGPKTQMIVKTKGMVEHPQQLLFF